ncbi:hypothetical protein MYX78_11400 [Acidobacteria bacterium AH-259-G07]|nr:hypothetical protein [Acidobacteria bacterium AH-259-G07]
MSLTDPSLLNRFEILDVVGTGPNGTVYQARHRLLGEMRALKVLSPRFSEIPLEEKTVRRFRLAKSLVSGHSQRLYELETDP